jgi:hypothetical protein
MSDMTIIALTGKARSGKDTAALVIREYLDQYHDNTEEFTDCYVLGLEAFAAPIKSMVAMLLDYFGLGSVMRQDILAPYIDGDKKEEVIPEIGASPRKLMQTLGTDWGRNCIDKSLWLNSMRARIKGYTDVANFGYRGAIVVVTDCRFDNEAELIKELGGLVVRVVRDETPEVGEDSHPSEAGVSDELVGLTVHNNGTVEEFRAALIKALGDLLPAIPEVRVEEEAATIEDEDNDVEERSAART